MKKGSLQEGDQIVVLAAQGLEKCIKLCNSDA